ncbi:hypothetical protein [Variovorax sp. HJSM1_2]|uniref:hypothetical protein n=1 Tax=Variovorax sp. HJSM1_2 TaxID=3366263 RepID=UPI003BCAE5F8
MSTPTPPHTEPAAPGSELREAPNWEQLVQRASREEETSEARAAQLQPRSMALDEVRRAPWRQVATLLLLVGLLCSALWWLLPPSPPSPADLDRGRRAMLELLAANLADHVQVNGDYPEDLQTVMPLDVGVTYLRVRGGYQLSVNLSDGRRLTVKNP